MGGFNGPPFETYGTAREVVVTFNGEDVEWGDEQGLCAVCHAEWEAAMWAHDMCAACQSCHAHYGSTCIAGCGTQGWGPGVPEQ